MKVLQINSVCGYGSTGRIVTDIYKILEVQGHECLIAYGRGTAPKEINSIKIGTKVDNYMHVAKSRIFDMHGFGSENATKEFIIKAKEYNPDIIHLHNIHGYYINIELLFDYLKTANKPVVWTLHDCWAFTGHCTHFDYIGCEKWKKECNKCPQLKEYPQSVFSDNSKNNYYRKKEIINRINNLTIATPSIWLANRVNESFLSQNKVKVINNGVDTSIFRKSESNIRSIYGIENKFVILGVSSLWTTKKGKDFFLELSNNIKPNEIIVMIGLTKEEQKKMPSNIIGIERTNNINELAQFYSMADVFLNPTLEDNYPTVNLESIACGTPVISFDSGGSHETFSEKEGILIKDKSVAAILNAIERFQKSPIIITDINFDVDKRNKYGDYLELYKKKLRGESIDENFIFN